MEHPDSWNLLTASLAVSNLDKKSDTWAFLAVQGLVRDEESDRDRFAAIVGEVQAEGPITGPTEALRIASQLTSEGIALPRAQAPDPSAGTAKPRRDTIDGWLAES